MSVNPTVIKSMFLEYPQMLLYGLGLQKSERVIGKRQPHYVLSAAEKCTKHTP